MTFGGLALGVGMIVDASIVVLENTFRHMEKGKSRMQAAIEGSEEVWSAILASTLTHIAVFVPLLFLTRRLEHPVRAALGRRDVLAVDVAVRRGHGRAGALLAAAEAAAAGRASARASSGKLLHGRASGCFERHGRLLPPRDCTRRCTTGRRCSSAPRR